MCIFPHFKKHSTLVDIFTFGLRMCKVKSKGKGIIETRVHEARVTLKFCNALPYVLYMVWKNNATFKEWSFMFLIKLMMKIEHLPWK
jgi:hypothetical protein